MKTALEKIVDAEWASFLSGFDSKPPKELVLILLPVFLAGFISGAKATLRDIRMEVLLKNR